MKKTLAIVKPASVNLPATTPPPRKEDIINAMVERARVKHAEERLRLECLKAQAKAKFSEAVFAELKSKPENFSVRVTGDYSPPEIEYRLNVISPHIEKLRMAYKSAPLLGGFDEQAVKRKIRQGMNVNASDRVKALLANPDAVKALDAALENITK